MIISNKLNTSAVIHVAASTTLTIAGNDSVSNVAVASSGEVISGVSITKVMWGVANNAADSFWEIKRGSNTVLVLPGSGTLNFTKNGCAITQDASGTLVMTLTNTTKGFLVVEVKKQ